MNIVTNPRERTRFIKFAIVGLIGAVVDFGVLNLITVFDLLPDFIETTQLRALVAQAISFSAAVTSNFVWNRYWTYPDSRRKRKRKQLPQFFTVNLIGLAIRTPIFGGVHLLLVRWLDGVVEPSAVELISNNFALAVAVGTVMFWNFFINRYWTYADVD